jgi:hypothetical protein
MTMTTAAAQVELEPPVLDEPALARGHRPRVRTRILSGKRSAKLVGRRLEHPNRGVLSRRTIRRLPE